MFFKRVRDGYFCALGQRVRESVWVGACANARECVDACVNDTEIAIDCFVLSVLGFVYRQVEKLPLGKLKLSQCLRLIRGERAFFWQH